MRNRVLQVRMVKNDKNEAPKAEKPDVSLEGKAAIIGHYLESSVAKIGSAVVTYVLVDTFRQVMVARAKK